MDPEPPRLALALSALGGAAFWGLYTVAVTFAAGKPLAGRDIARALLNVAAGILAGVLAAVFLGPALMALMPVVQLRDPHVIGFALGAGAWEIAPFAYRLLRGRAARAVKENR